MGRRASSTIAWSLAVGWVGALAIGAAGWALTVLVDVASVALGMLGHPPSEPTSSTEIWVVTGASMALCLAVACGGGWTLAGAPDGLVPRWAAGLAAGLLGVAAGATAFALRFGFIAP